MIAEAARALHQGPVRPPPAGRAPGLVTRARREPARSTTSRRGARQREAGLALRQQAVLFRAAHHSGALEVELARRNIPFVKYGGLQVPRGRARQGPAGVPALGREPARPASPASACCSSARHRPGHRRDAARRARTRHRAATALGASSRPPRAARLAGVRCALALARRATPGWPASSTWSAAGTSRISSAHLRRRGDAPPPTSSSSSRSPRPFPTARALPRRAHPRSAGRDRRPGRAAATSTRTT